MLFAHSRGSQEKPRRKTFSQISQNDDDDDNDDGADGGSGDDDDNDDNDIDDDDDDDDDDDNDNDDWLGNVNDWVLLSMNIFFMFTWRCKVVFQEQIE